MYLAFLMSTMQIYTFFHFSETDYIISALPNAEIHQACTIQFDLLNLCFYPSCFNVNPWATLLVISKLLESIIQKKIVDHLKSNNSPIDTHYGFNSSTSNTDVFPNHHILNLRDKSLRVSICPTSSSALTSMGDYSLFPKLIISDRSTDVIYIIW